MLWQVRCCTFHLQKHDMPARRLVAVAQACGAFRGWSTAGMRHSRGGALACPVGSGSGRGGSVGWPFWGAVRGVLILRGWICVHLGGHPADLDSLRSITTPHGIPLIEDCAQSLGASWNGTRTGALGDIAVFSFAATKNITAGEGGAVVTHDPDLAARVASLRDHGRPLN